MKKIKYIFIIAIPFLLFSLLIATQSKAEVEPFPGDNYFVAPEMPEQTELLHSALSSTACQEADVAIIFTNDATSYIGAENTSQWAAERIAETNRVLRNSDICHRIRLVHTSNNVGPSQGDEKDMSDLGSIRWPEWGARGSMRNNTGADYLVLITSPTTGAGGTSKWCGLGFVPNSFNLDFIEYVRAVVSADCGGLVTAHELGHNFGGMHDANTSPNCVTGPLVPNSCGGFLPSLGSITVMSYFQTGFDTWIEHYSNPNVFFNGVPTGQDATQNNANTIRQALAFFYAMKPRMVASDVTLKSNQVVVLPQGSVVTLSGRLLIADSSVNTSLGEATVTGNSWQLTTTINPSITSIDVKVNEGHAQTFPLVVKVASATISGVITGGNGVALQILPDLGIPSVSNVNGNYQVSVVPGSRVLTAFSFDPATQLFCGNTVTVQANGNVVKNFSVTCKEGSQTFMPIITD